MWLDCARPVAPAQLNKSLSGAPIGFSSNRGITPRRHALAAYALLWARILPGPSYTALVGDPASRHPASSAPRASDVGASLGTGLLARGAPPLSGGWRGHWGRDRFCARRPEQQMRHELCAWCNGFAPGRHGRLCHPRVTAFDANRAVFVPLSRRNGGPALPS